MYLIRLPSGREARFETLQELVAAIARGDVQREALIYHRLSEQWVPIERHPHFQAHPELPAPAPTTGQQPPAPPEPAPVLPPSAAAPRPAMPERSVEPRGSSATALVPERQHVDTGERFEPRARREGRRSRAAIAAAAVVILGGAAGIGIGWKLRPSESAGGRLFRYEPAPAPSSLLRPEPAPAPTRSEPAPPTSRRQDPLAPVTAAQLANRREAAFTASRTQLADELAAVGLPQVFGVRALSTQEGARAARRVVASALNVVGQFHRREIMMDQAYRDTAAFQTTRAGWSAEERRGWEERSSLREPYASADLAESLLADADSLLAILAANPFTIRGDTLDFDDAAVAASYRAQRLRITERSGPPVGDPDRRPTLAQVQRSVNPAQLPYAAP